MFFSAKKIKDSDKKQKKEAAKNGVPPIPDEEAENEALNKEPGNGLVQCLNNIDLSIKPGQFLGVVGHIGAGKSSLISAIMGEVNAN